MNTVDAPKEEVTDETIKKNYKIIKNNCKMKLIVKADTLKITKQRFTHIVHEYLDMTKLYMQKGCLPDP